MAEISYSPRAVVDLERIWSYIAYELHSPQAADNIVNAVTKRIRSLERFPNSGPSVAALSGRSTDLRYLVCKNRVVVYRVRGEGLESTVYILRVFSGGENWVNSLFGDEFTDEI